ncbi:MULTISPECIES: OsmC family protein [unclassified Arthrobacter]|uniref:OsmC family protein n=1 Tax=unclassified Arthrobacter TaxID=235627 RepID=UPI000422339C|nr:MULTISPECIES: OsmC family protein [unclassified Arthrobacter]
MTTLVETRGFTFRTDEPVAVGGNDKSPTPMQYVVGAVNGCVTVVIETVARELGIVVEAIDTSSQAQQDVRGFRGTADVSPHFKNFALTVNLRTPVPESELDTFKRQVEKRCPAINLVRDAGVDFNLVWLISGAEA